MTKPEKFKTKKCVLNCVNEQKLKMLELLGTPLCRTEMHVRQLSDNGRTITPKSYPGIYIPGKMNPTLPTAFKSSGVIQPLAPSKNLYSSPTVVTNNIPHNIKQCTMITSSSSKCYLKCKTYESLHRFPSDLISQSIWVGKLKLPPTVKLYSTARICGNHFSPVMKSSRLLSRCAVPDMNLPPQCRFIDEFEPLPSEESIIETSYDQITSSDAYLQPMLMDEPITSDTYSRPIVNDKPTTTADILTNPISNIKSVGTDSTAENEGTPFPFQHPAVESTSAFDVILPENYNNALFECVLKCPDPKILYRFPNVESRRQLWLTQIGLTHCFCNTRICSRHFSEKMLSNKRLTNSSYPDLNLQPRIRVATLPLQDELFPKVQEIPQYICVLTVVTQNSGITKMINDTEYIKYTVDKITPKREFSVQVEMDNLVEKANKSILADEDFDDDDEEKSEIIENINYEQQSDSAQVFPSKSKDMFECLKCGEITLDYESNRKHSNLHNELSRLCFLCGRTFMSEVKLKLHEMKTHILMESKQLKRCPKEHCKKAFHSRKNLDQHLIEHAKPTRHSCCNCGRRFFSSLKLSCHMLACRPRRRAKRKKQCFR